MGFEQPPKNNKGESRFRPKSPEEIQAQIGAFTSERSKQHKDKKHILKNIEEIVADEPQDVTRITQEDEYHKGGDGKIKMAKIPEGTERTAASAKDYLDYLRQVKGSKYEGVQRRAEMLKAYERFAPVIDRLKDELSDPEIRKEHPAFLGSGTNSMAFSIIDDDKKYAVRVPRGKAVQPAVIDSHLAGAVLGKGIPHLEQIVAGSYKDGVTVSEIMPGKEVRNLSVEEIQQITYEQLSDLVDTIITANAKGIEIDPKASNLFYDPEAGFGIIDYHSSKDASKSSADQKVSEVLGWVAGIYGRSYSPMTTAEEYASEAEFMKSNINVLKRYRKVVESKLQEEACENALRVIDSKIEFEQKMIANYSDPKWVTEQMAEKEERRQQIKNADKRELDVINIDSDLI